MRFPWILLAPLSSAVVAGAASPAAGQEDAAEAALTRPSEAQARWQELELGIFLHFGINTFHAVEWSDGTLDPKSFNPAELDADQWARAASEAGARYVILTAKHHDGFCLWPTKTTTYSVKSSPWRSGAGDVVREAAEACARYKLGFGVYLSPWDRHEPRYADAAAYDDFYARQLEELLTGYGPLVEVWFDGAGSEGRKYDWARISALVKAHQPDAMIFNMGVPTIRWSGNERGFAPEPCWNVVEEKDVLLFAGGRVKSQGTGTVWLPVECDVPIRRGWFWCPESEAAVKSLEELLVIYYRSVGRGANLLLNVAPDNRGLLPAADVDRLLGLAKEVRQRFTTSLATAGGEGMEIVLDLGGAKRVDHVVLREDIRRGERIHRYVIEAGSGEGWKTVGGGESLGAKKIHWFEPVRTTSLRLRVLESAAPPIVREFSAYEAAGGEAGDLYAEAKRQLGNGRPPSAALRDLSRAIERVPAFGPFHLLRSILNEQEGKLEDALSDLDLVLSLREELGEVHHLRAGVLFKLERFEEALRDYNIAVAGGQPHDSDACWERGLAWYYLGDFDAGRKQFEGYHRVGPLDIENGLWRFLSIAAKEGEAKAGETMIEYSQKTRKPFPALLALYSGTGSPEEVLREATAGVESDEEKNENLFYAHYYIGKHFELRREREQALSHLRQALTHRISHFMYACARIDLKRLEAK